MAGLVYAAAGFPGLCSRAAALMSGFVTSRAGWVESSESNSFHTYLML